MFKNHYDAMPCAVRLSGRIATPVFVHHECHENQFLQFTLSVCRTSGAEDLLPIMIPAAMVGGFDNAQKLLPVGTWFSMDGDIRSYNDEGFHLNVVGYVRQYELGKQVYENDVHIVGAICKRPAFRQTPFGRKICDIMLANNRFGGRCSYIPCIVWGSTAVFGSHLPIGQHLEIAGRFQSRKYTKVLENGNCEERTTYEVSGARLFLLPDSTDAQVTA